MKTTTRVPYCFAVALWLGLLLLPAQARDLAGSALDSAKPVQAWDLARYLEEKMGVPFDGTSPYLVVELAGGQLALFRSEPDDEPWGSQAEVAGYRLSQRLGLTGLVPRTVVRRLERADFPDGDWPYAEQSRLGSLQSFLPARPATQEEVDAMPAERRAALEILSFVMGRYDNHLGNTLVDADGAVFIVDFENALEHQQARFGEYSFVRKGRERNDLPSVSKEKPFPFDQATALASPSLAQLEAVLAPYWAPWSGSFEPLHQLVIHSNDSSLHSVVWDHRVWLQIKVRSRHPAYTDVYPPELLKHLRTLTLEELERDILLPPFTSQHAEAILQRRDQVLAAAAKAGP